MKTESDPMLPRRCFCYDQFGDEMAAIASVDPEGDWYRREEVDALVADHDRIVAELRAKLESAETRVRDLSREIVANGDHWQAERDRLVAKLESAEKDRNTAVSLLKRYGDSKTSRLHSAMWLDQVGALLSRLAAIDAAMGEK